jgi:hypothetical protein
MLKVGGRLKPFLKDIRLTKQGAIPGYLRDIRQSSNQE